MSAAVLNRPEVDRRLGLIVAKPSSYQGNGRDDGLDAFGDVLERFVVQLF